MKRTLKVLSALMLVFSVFGVQLALAAPKPPTIEAKSAISETVVEGTDDEYEVTVSVTGKDPENNGIYKETDVVLIIDNSGSMDSVKKLPEAQASAKKFVDQLLVADSQVKIAVINFNTYAELTHTWSNDKNSLHTAIDGLSPGLSTQPSKAINLAKEEFSKGRSTADKVMVLLSDGRPEYEEPKMGFDAAESLVQEYPNITIKTIGYDVNTTEAAYLTTIADKDSKAGGYYDAKVGTLDTVFDDIVVDLFGAIDDVKVTSTIQKPFELVQGSFKVEKGNPSADGKELVVCNQEKFAKNELEVTTGALSNGKEVVFKYKIKIVQAEAAKIERNKDNTDFTYNYEYKKGNETVKEKKTTTVAPKVFKVTTVNDENGKFCDSRFVGNGANFDITWAVADGYKMTNLYVNDKDTDFNGTYSQIMNIREDKVVKGVFVTEKQTGGNGDGNGSDGNTANKNNGPITGDVANVALITLLLAGSMGGALLLYKKKVLKADQ